MKDTFYLAMTLVAVATQLATSPAIAMGPEVLLGKLPSMSELRSQESTSARIPSPYFEYSRIEISGPGAVNSISQSLNTNLLQEKGEFRGAAEIGLFEKASPSVVLILTEEGSGTGSVVDGRGSIVTNWHVVGDAPYVQIVFRPEDTAKEVFAEKTHLAKVIRTDEVVDLALIQLINPSVSPAPLKLASKEPKIGEDVVAIGHPFGFNWTLTKGIVTGVRDNYNWRYDSMRQHLADVIQTQTPINPGNSGGPLFNEDMEIIGVNSFGSKGELINFAVKTSVLKDFLLSDSSRVAPTLMDATPLNRAPTGCDKWATIGDGWLSDKAQSFMVAMDTNCDGVSDGIAEIPNNTETGFTRFFMDTNSDESIDVTLLDIENDGRWDFSFYDVNGDSSYDVVGTFDENGREASFMSWEQFNFEG